MIQKKQTYLFLALIIFFLAMLVGLTWVNYQYSIQQPGGNDFIARWMGARYWLLDGVSPYSDDVSLAAQQMIYGHPAKAVNGEDLNHFVYPLFSMIFSAPLGLLDYNLARSIWMTSLEISLVLVAVFSLQISGWSLKPLEIAGILLFSLLSYNGMRTLINAQFSGINAVLILGALICIMKKRDLDAGLLLALSLSKPHMSILLVVITFLWAFSVRRMRLVIGISAGFAFLMAGSLIFLPEWPIQWLQKTLEYPTYTVQVGSISSIISGIMPGIRQPLSLVLNGIFIIYLLLEWAHSWKKNERVYLWTALLTIVMTNFISPRTATPHYVLFLPILFFTFRLWQQKWGNRGRIAAWLCIFIIFVGSWVLFISTLNGNAEANIMFIPLPILCILFLWWIRGWFSQPTILYYEKIKG